MKVLVLATAVIAAMSVTPASAQSGRLVSALDPLPGGTFTRVRDINNNGMSVGGADNSSGAEQPVRWSATGRITALPVLPGQVGGTAMGISKSGTVVGSVTGTATRWAPDGAISELPTPQGQFSCTAYAINDTGGIVGNCANGAFRWANDGTIIPLPPVPGGLSAVVQAVNADGTSVGWSADNQYRYPVTWSPTGIAWRLSGLPGSAWDINDKGQVAGQIEVADGAPYTKYYAVRWETDGTMRNLGGAPGATKPNGRAAAINEDGTAVGDVTTDDGRQLGARWSADGVFTALGSIKPTDPQARTMAEAINDSGVIVGWSAEKAVRWTGYR
ncbi:hypothetical protein DMH04_53105 [Kibdelosporangium aridum]|uniref:Extracellular repeat, HAF family n=1 Tax=Kibdelosporangium aridum TaxID=2030 RepID=A0A428Y3D1_KIBAR|nr:hypothetical protein [Kibdelosporangium aridum]RSM62071.1 hypothetical protein DMH04_53105 [Kibdelosporangium aridum]